MVPANRLLACTRNLLQRNALPCKKFVECAKEYHVSSVPPRNKVPKAEFCAMSIALFVAIWSFPCWVMYHIPDYQKEDRNTYTGK